MDNLPFENRQKKVHTFYLGGRVVVKGYSDDLVFKKMRQNEKDKMNFCTLFQSCGV